MVFERKKYKKFALMQLKGRWTTVVLATLITSLVLFVFSFTENRGFVSIDQLRALGNASYEEILAFLSSTAKPVTLPFFILSLIEALVNFIFEIALAYLFIAISRSPDPVSLKVFFEGLNNWGRGILVGLWTTLWIFLWMLVAIPMSIVFLVPFILFEASADTIAMFTPILVIISFIPMFIKSIAYSMGVYLVAEFPNLPITRSLDISKKITKGYKWNIFVTELSFIGWILLCILTLGIGSLWLSPYINMTQVNIYHALIKDALETEKIHPEDLN